MAERRVHTLTGQQLCRLIDELSAEHVQSKGFGKRRERTDAADDDDSFVVVGNGANSNNATSSTSEELESYNESPKKLKAFRSECFVPVFTSNAEARALMFLTDALAQVHSPEDAAKLLSFIYRQQYHVGLPNDMQAGVRDYCKLARNNVDWPEHAMALRAQHAPELWKNTATQVHVAPWRAALHCAHAEQWSAFFHTLHSLGALRTGKTAKSIMERLSAGGRLCKTKEMQALEVSLEAERTLPKNAKRMIVCGRRILAQATLYVENCDGKDCAKLFNI